jgi:alkanesulfonate monooxygenase SsuD/methylene tetrahydromethanopterin reductase-like flavin-dependent oxidoreductase (luciferase family)
VQKPYPRIYVGGGVDAVARRAARFGTGLFPLNPKLVSIYREECARLGREPGPVILHLGWIHVTDDPEKSWRELAPHMIHVAKSYADWAAEGGWLTSPFAGVDTLEKLKASGLFHVLTPEESIKMAAHADEVGGELGLMPLLGGVDPAIGWKSLELFIDKVLPRVKRTTPAAP